MALYKVLFYKFSSYFFEFYSLIGKLRSREQYHVQCYKLIGDEVGFLWESSDPNSSLL